jgi:predicted dinucleotide-binding enzyme
MHIGILGIGRVGRALGETWARAGHSVLFGVRNGAGGVARLVRRDMPITSWRMAAGQSEVVVLALPPDEVLEAAATLAPLTGKIVLECSHPPACRDTAGGCATITEELARLVPEAHVVKIFNTVGSEVLGNPDFQGTRATMLYACNGEAEGVVAAGLAADAGFEPMRLGGLETCASLEEMTRIWGQLAHGQRLGRGLAFKLLLRDEVPQFSY